MFSLEKRGFGDDSGDSRDDSLKCFWGPRISTVATPAGMDMADGRHERSSEGAKSERRRKGGVLVAVSDASAGTNPNDVELV
jgi:hypothetical protein